MQSFPTKGLPGSGRLDSIEDKAWMHQPFHIQLPPENLDKKSLQQIFTERGQEVGLEPNKSAYKERLASFIGSESHHVSWVGKLFGEKPKSTKENPISQLRACKGENCGKNPRPKPCVGPKCPKPGPPNPLPPPVGGVCTTGYRSANGACKPWGYFKDCTYYVVDSRPGYCRVHWASVDSSYCWEILQEIRHQEMLLQQARLAQGAACSTASRSSDCAKLTEQINAGMSRIQQLQRQYQMCSAAARLYGP
jgi:hypothetical protein